MPKDGNSMKVRSIANVVRKTRLGRLSGDREYWLTRSPGERIAALEEIRREYNNWKYSDAQQRFREFLESLNSSEVKYLVLGGYALAFHGHPRYTKDLDVWLELSIEDEKAINN